ncbi:MAG: hypothetical protein Q4C96_01040 [Planctomycetia bacterium]|nr:hypothetical protein [Planctomycetia bacterium]
MNLLEYLEEVLKKIKAHGYQIREEWLDGGHGGGCVLRGKKIFFSDQTLPLPERLEQAEEFLRELNTKE